MSGRSSTSLFAGWLPVGLLALIAVTLAGIPARAQEPSHQHRSILDIIFGRHPEQREMQPPPTRRAAPRRRAPSHHHTATRPKPAASAPPPVEKLDNARKILVVGDFMASGLADGLEDAFADSPGVTVVDKTNGSSGLVRDDFYDWPAHIGPLLDSVKPAVTVVLIGSNDRQPMRIDGHTEPVRSDAWTAEYAKRVERLADAVVSRHVPLLWAAVPAFHSASMSADILAFDGIFHSVVAKAGGQFIDTWDGFVDQNGDFVFSGPDINGQPVRLRGADGINLTAAGKRKLAFYVEKPIRRLLGDATDKDIATLGGENLLPLTALPLQLPTRIVRTDPIGLDDPSLDGDTALLGGPAAGPAAKISAAEDAPRARLVNEGEMETPPAGRADSFAWNDGSAKPDAASASTPKETGPGRGTTLPPKGAVPHASPAP